MFFYTCYKNIFSLKNLCANKRYTDVHPNVLFRNFGILKYSFLIVGASTPTSQTRFPASLCLLNSIVPLMLAKNGEKASFY